MYASPFDENANSAVTSSNVHAESDNNYLNKKRQTHNKTIKKYPKENFDTEKVNSVLEKIHNEQKTEDDEKSALGDFNPPPNPQSAGVYKTRATEQMMNMTTNNNEMMFKTLGRAPQPNYPSDDLALNDYNNYGDSKSTEEYYKKMLPGYSSQQQQQQQQQQHQQQQRNNNRYHQPMELPNQDVLMQKLNYMISLLEEQEDERTNNVMEEVILYSFLGIFIIFVADSFAKIGKYVR